MVAVVNKVIPDRNKNDCFLNFILNVMSMMNIITTLALLFVVYLGFWIGVILGFLALDELNSFFFKIFRINAFLFYGIVPFFFLLPSKSHLIISSLFFLLGFPIGSKEVLPYLKKKKIKDKKKLIISCLAKTSIFLCSSLIVIFIQYLLY